MDTTRNTWIAVVILIIIVALGAWIYVSNSNKGTQAPATGTTSSSTASSGQSRTLVATARYACDKGKTITAAYYQGPAAPQPAPGQPPTPTGSVDVSLDGGATSTLKQTISADGARYATTDESFVFWSKGNTALIMRNNSMDLNYRNCTVATSTSAS